VYDVNGLLVDTNVNGPLVDTNYQRALAWYRAFRRHQIVVPVWRIHRHIGMGGDQAVRALTDARIRSPTPAPGRFREPPAV
jgi:beta-phosphoglucomutase-like phosphatase (HAD superfamily)